MNLGDNPSVTRRFAAAAATYDHHAHVQRDTAAALMEGVPALPAAARILEAGCGTGHLTRLLAARFPAARIDAFDAARGMVEAARARVPVPGVCWHVAAFDAFSAEAPYDLIVSNAALHWAPALPAVMHHLFSHLRPGGRLLAAVMVEGTLAELHAARRRAAPHKPPRIALPPAPEVEAACAACAPAALYCRVRQFEARYPSAAAFVRALREMGLTGGTGGPALVRGELRRLLEDYDARYAGPGGHVLATYRVLFVDATAAGSATC